MNSDNDDIEELVQSGAISSYVSVEESKTLINANKENNIRILSSLLESGSDQNNQCISTNLDYPTLLLSLLHDDFSKRKPSLIKLLVDHGHGGNIISNSARYSIHRSIAMKEFNILNALISTGEFGPSLMNIVSHFCLIPNSYDDRSSECTINKTLLKRFASLLSPFCMALLCGHVRTAEELVTANYLMATDYTSLPRDMRFKEELKARKLKQSLTFLKEFSSTPLTLFSLSFVCVSDSVGSSVGRENRIKKLGIPPAVERALLFQCNDQVIGDSDNDLSSRHLDNNLLWRNQIDKLRFLWSFRPSSVFGFDL